MLKQQMRKNKKGIILKISLLGGLLAFFALSEVSQVFGTAPYNRGAFVRLICGIDKYNVSGACTAVGNGYYAPNATNTRTACTNGGSNVTYTSSGGGANSCSWGCILDYYLNGTCVAVGNGYYSPDANNSRTACTNGGSNVTYTSSGGGINNCSWGCATDYYLSGTCIAVGNGYYSPNIDNSRYTCTNAKPTYSYYSGSGGGVDNCPNTCNTGYYPEGTCNCWNNLSPEWRNGCL